MIKANEIRIGNFIFDRGGKVLIVDGWENSTKIFQSQGFYYLPEPIGKSPYHPLTEDINFAQPIPISEKFLIDFGFEEIEDTYSDVEKCYINEDLNLYVVYNKGVYEVGLGFQDYNKEIQFIHQLQNFVFALKDCELKYNPVLSAKVIGTMPATEGTSTRKI